MDSYGGDGNTGRGAAIVEEQEAILQESCLPPPPSPPTSANTNTHIKSTSEDCSPAGVLKMALD